jgi:hypothetical protein
LGYLEAKTKATADSSAALRNDKQKSDGNRPQSNGNSDDSCFNIDFNNYGISLRRRL